MLNYFSIVVYLASKNCKAFVDLSGSITVEELLDEAKQRWNLPTNSDYSVIVERTGERLNLCQTFDTVGIENNDALVIYPESKIEFSRDEVYDTQNSSIAEKLDTSSPLVLPHSGVELPPISERKEFPFCLLPSEQISLRPVFFNIIVRSVDGTYEQAIELPSTIEAGELLQRTKQWWNLPNNIPFYLVLERTCQVLNLSRSLGVLGIKNNDTITIVPEAEGGGMIIHGLIVEQLEANGSLKTFKMHASEPHGELIVALADEYEEPREGPFYFLERQDAETFSKGFAECQCRRIGKKNFRVLDRTYEFYVQWRGIPTERSKTSYYALSLPEYAIPELIQIVNPRNPSREFQRSVVRDDQTNRFIVYLDCRSSYGQFDFDLICKFIIETSKFSSSQYSDSFTTSYGYPDTWKYALEAEETAKVQDFFREQEKNCIEMNFYAPVGNAAGNVQGSQESSNTTTHLS